MSTDTLTEPRESEEYFGLPGLSNSGMTDLAVSPYRYWYLHVNPDRKPKEETPAMAFGSALHCAVLEPEKFGDRYARKLDRYGMLDTATDLKEWLTSHDIKPKGSVKADWITQIQATDPSVPIYDVAYAKFCRDTIGKTLLQGDDADRVQACANSLLREPKVAEILSDGEAEVMLTARDPETGVLLKGKLDWTSPAVTMDLKTFSQQRGKSIDKSIADAIWYEQYHRTAYFYSYLRSLQPGFPKPGAAAVAPPFVLAFVESELPHEVRLREIRAKHFGEVNMLWETARIQVREHIRTYADCIERYGFSPWRSHQEIEELCDEDIRQLSFT